MIRTPLSLLALLVVLASPFTLSADPGDAVQGHGYVFESVDQAAVDALALAHQNSLASGRPRLSRGGTIVAVEGGYTYHELVVAAPGAPDSLRLQLHPDAVAHFHTYPSQGKGLDRLNETHSPADRRVVDQSDSRHRPSYILTPSLRVVVYRGRDANEPLDDLVADLAEPRRRGWLAQR